MYLLGIDLGSSAVKASLVDAASGKAVASAQSPATEELPISSPQPGWAEQDPESWWKHARLAARAACAGHDRSKIGAVGISYQMHGLVALDAELRPVRPAIIWCDSRAVGHGRDAFDALGAGLCLSRLLNSPGNFTAAKLRWVQMCDPEVFARVRKIMLPGDYLALRMTGSAQTTASGLSEGTLWDFTNHSPATFLLDHWNMDHGLLPDIVPTFGIQAEVSAAAAEELGIPAGVPVAYRAGDQPNNALSLNVLNPGEIAATAGTSGVVYGVSGRPGHDPAQRVNGFAHVNHQAADPRIGVLLCINGCGILYAWLRRVLGGGLSYPEINALAAAVPAGSDGLTVLPFGNGAERMLGNRWTGCQWSGIDFPRHQSGHLARAAQEGIAFAFRHGIEGMRSTGLVPTKLRAGDANLFQSPVFRETLASTLGVTIELVNTHGAVGAALGAGLGAGVFSSTREAFAGLTVLQTIEPDPALTAPCEEAFARWEATLSKALS